MQKYNGTLLRKFDDPVHGNASVGTSVVVRKKSDNSIAPIYSVDDINSIQKPNPFTTDAFGRYSFFAPNGKYILQFGDGSDEIEISMVDNLDLSSYRKAATVVQVENGDFEIGARLLLIDREDAPFNIEPIGDYVVNGFDILNAGIGKVAVYSEKLNILIEHFGAKPNDPSHDSSPAINAAFTWASTQGYVVSNVDLGSYGYLGSKPEIKSTTGAFYIGNTVSIASNYDNFDFSNALFLPHSSFLETDYAFDMEVWNSSLKRIRLAKFKLGIYAHNANLDGGVVTFEDLQASNVENLLTIDLRSTQTVVEKYRLDNVKIVAEVINGDRVIFDKGFFSAGVFDADTDAHFVMNSPESAGLEILRMFYVPRPQNKLRTSIVKILNSPSRVTIDCGLFGGEPGSITLVANYVTGSAQQRGCHITINNTLSFMSSGGTPVIPLVDLYALPNSVVINDNTGLIEETHTKNLINFNTAVRTFEQAKSLLEAANAKMQISICGRRINNFVGFTYEQAKTIGLYDTSPLSQSRKQVLGVTNASGVVIFHANTAGRGATHRVMLFTPDNNGPDRYSEYIVTASPQIAPSAQWSLLTLTQSTSTVGGTLFESGGSILLRGNSVASTDIYILSQELSNVDVYS